MASRHRPRRDRRRKGTPENHSDCPEYLTGTAFRLGTAVTASTYPPIVQGPYTAPPFICPHGVRFWIEPTGEQIAEWVKDGVS